MPSSGGDMNPVSTRAGASINYSYAERHSTQILASSTSNRNLHDNSGLTQKQEAIKRIIKQQQLQSQLKDFDTPPIIINNNELSS